MRSSSLLLVLLILSGCGASWHLMRAEHHLKKAELKGAVIKSDTVFVERIVTVPEVKTDTVFKSEIGDTVYIDKDRLHIKYVKLPGDSVFIQGKCDTIKQVIKVPVSITKEIHAPKGFKDYLLWIVIVMLVAAVGYLINSIRRK